MKLIKGLVGVHLVRFDFPVNIIMREWMQLDGMGLYRVNLLHFSLSDFICFFTFTQLNSIILFLLV